MSHLIPLSRLARLVDKPRSELQRMAQTGVLTTFDGFVELEEVLRHFPDVKLGDDAELRRVEEIKEQASSKAPPLDMPEPHVMYERLRVLGREYAAARGKLMTAFLDQMFQSEF